MTELHVHVTDTQVVCGQVIHGCFACFWNRRKATGSRRRQATGREEKFPLIKSFCTPGGGNILLNDTMSPVHRADHNFILYSHIGIV